MELSLRESLLLGHNYIGPEHLLLGLLREGDGVGAQVLTKLGADLGATRDRVMMLLLGTEEEHTEAFPWVQAAETMRQEAPEPNCPRCRSPLLGLARSESFTVPAAGGRTRWVLALFCGRCGTTLGLLPDDGLEPELPAEPPGAAGEG